MIELGRRDIDQEQIQYPNLDRGEPETAAALARFCSSPDSPLEEARFEPSLPLWLGAFTRSKTSMSGPVRVGGFEEGEFEGDGPLEKVAAQILLRGADAVQLRAQEIDEAAKPRIVVQRDPLGVHEIHRQRLRRAGGPVEIEPFGHDEDRKRGGIAARFGGLAHDRLEAGGRLRIGIGRASVLRDWVSCLDNSSA